MTMTISIKNHKRFLTKLNTFIVFGIISLSLGCHSTTTNSDESLTDKKPTVFEGFAASIHNITLPFRDTCFDTVAVQRLKIPDSLSKLTKYGQIIGKVNETDNYIAILFSKEGDVQLPILRTFTHSGEMISTQKLLIGICCGENEDCSGLSSFEISKDLKITLKDSTLTFTRDKKKFDKKMNIKSETKLEEYIIDNSGNIKKVQPNA